MKQAAFLHHSLFPDGAGSRLFPSGSEKRSTVQDFATGNLESSSISTVGFTEKVKKRHNFSEIIASPNFCRALISKILPLMINKYLTLGSRRHAKQ